jgi:hypothetical protein
MTRAANYVCDKVRENIDKVFRIEQGVLLVRRGMGMDMMEHTYRLEYGERERVERPLPRPAEIHARSGLARHHVGEGQDPA